MICFVAEMFPQIVATQLSRHDSPLMAAAVCRHLRAAFFSRSRRYFLTSASGGEGGGPASLKREARVYTRLPTPIPIHPSVLSHRCITAGAADCEPHVGTLRKTTLSTSTLNQGRIMVICRATSLLRPAQTEEGSFSFLF